MKEAGNRHVNRESSESSSKDSLSTRFIPPEIMPSPKLPPTTITTIITTSTTTVSKSTQQASKPEGG
ncbi:hypothetical protein CHS0354_030580 [Potamilus streckersoni]|uniref:Uncharacterized protein n=1 Tax=Potamilus streckersoni TaxID=2493646 RepID=A0AAE0SD25_9BIVA|nr:hypothetical protein CHS0354_030580 [Potamilus streckersoni]